MCVNIRQFYNRVTEIAVCTLGQTELTDEMIVGFCGRITKEIDIFLLALIGMKMPKQVVEACIANHPRDLREAMIDILNYYITYHHWNDRNASYTGLCTALKHREVKLNYLIKEVLEKKETGTVEGLEGRE